MTFGATLHQEEGRRVTFRLAFVSADGAVKSNLAVFLFREAILLTARAIAKLAPSMNPADAYLGIQPGSNGALSIWGIIHRGLDREHLAPYFLTVTALKPGSFAVEFLAQSKLLYSRGQVHFQKGNPKHLTDELRDGARFSGRIAQEFERITGSMLALGHGGTILIVEDGQEPVSLELHRSYTYLNSTCDILKKAAHADEQAQSGEAAREGMSEGRFQVWREEQRRRHIEAIDFVAQLTAVDGATVMTDSLAVLGFGATIQTYDADGVTVDASDPLDRGFKPAFLSDFPGNRHRSAILWCAAQTSGLALAIVASQDGDVSLFGRSGGFKHVTAIRPFGWRRGLA